MKIGSLCSGIGMLELGLEWAGLGETVWQVEIEPECRAVLGHHWPEAKRFKDVTKVQPQDLEPVGLVCAGFPCTDVSSAGTRVGLSGAQSGLWYECRRIIEGLSPPFVVIENVTSGKAKWLCEVRKRRVGQAVRPTDHHPDAHRIVQPRAAATFVSWPPNYDHNGLHKLLDRSPVVMYLGKNTDGAACGGQRMFSRLSQREVLAHVPERRNTLIVYGSKLETRDFLGEEMAALTSLEKMWTFAELEGS